MAGERPSTAESDSKAGGERVSTAEPEGDGIVVNRMRELTFRTGPPQHGRLGLGGGE